MRKTIQITEVTYEFLLKKMRGKDTFDMVLQKLLHLRPKEKAQALGVGIVTPGEGEAGAKETDGRL